MKKMRILFAILLALALAVTSVSVGSVQAAGLYTPGTYEASVNGMNGPVTVTVEFSESEITNVTAVGEKETPGIGSLAIEQLPAAILAAQSTEIDGVTGATVTSNALLQAATACVKEASGAADEQAVATEEYADVVIVGAGAAGLSAASAAHESGASVIVLEANSFIGGAAGTSMGNILGLDMGVFAEEARNDAALAKYDSYTPEDFPEPWRTDFCTLQEQLAEYRNNGKETGKFVTIERVLVDHYLKGRGKDLEGNEVTLDYDMIRAGVENGQSIYDWLVELGMTTTPLMEYVYTPAGRGMGLIELLNNACDGVDIRLNTRASELVVEDGRVVGVIADSNGSKVTFHAAQGVVLATGSFSSNGEMVAKYQRIGTGLTANIPSNNPAFNLGDGIVMAEALGAELRDMSFIQTYLKGYQNLATSGEASTAFGAAQLVVNADGVRFADDSNQQRIVSREGNDQPDGILLAVGDSKMIEKMDASSEGFTDKLIDRGIAFTADTLEEAAKLAGLDPAALTASVDTFNGYVAEGADADFGRKSFNGAVAEAPFVIVKLQLAAHLTFGGLVIDNDAHVLDQDGQPISGLYAAGDVVSGYEGIVHQSGNCLTIIINTGKTAGSNAAAGK